MDAQKPILSLKTKDRPYEYLKRKNGAWINANDIAFACKVTRAQVGQYLCAKEGVESIKSGRHPSASAYRVVVAGIGDTQTGVGE